MRITIDLDSAGVSVGNSAMQVGTESSDAQNAGTGPGATGPASDTAGDASNTGGPPQWLLDAVNKAMGEAKETVTTDNTQAADGGAGPA